MFRIRKIFENDLTAILKIEGEISNGNLQDWINETKSFITICNQQIILDICDVTFMSPQAVDMLIELISENIYLLNTPKIVRNILHSAGLSMHVLE
ncbi:MAG: STAS domain-containing protein [bacterium]